MKAPRIRRGTIWLSLALLLLLPAVCSCRAGSGPGIAIVAPSDGTVIASSNVSVTISVANFGLVDTVGGSSGSQREGRVIFYLDVTPPTHQGWTAMTRRGSYKATTATTCTWQNVRPGKHVLGAQLVTGANEPLIVPQVLTVTVDVVTPPRTPIKTDLIATAGQFNLETITVPAGADVIITFVNNDDTPHNFSLYETTAATQVLFKGETITGPTKIIYRFKAPVIPGDYFFRSDTNPDTMTGTFKVTPE